MGKSINQKGFLNYDLRSNKYSINWKKTTSVIVGELLLEEILSVRSHMKGRLLDVGCGERPYRLVYDNQVEMSVGTEVPWSLHGTADSDVICYAEQLPFPDKSFDFILCTEVLEHTQQPFQVMRELARLLKPGGYLFLSVPFIYPIHEAPNDYWRFTTHGLALACRSVGIQPLSIRSKGGPFASFLALWVNVTVRATNGFGKILGLKRPLSESITFRWLIALPQKMYLWIVRKMLTSKWSATVKDRFSVVFRRSGWLDELNSWMTAGYMVLVQKPMNTNSPEEGVSGNEISLTQH
ncbi:MAG: class I SAM-dependent methyltransferase [Armatimonadota bacterium]